MSESYGFPDTDGPVLVAYSGGKDSLAVLDLAVTRYGESRVRPFFMYFLRDQSGDLDYTNAMCDWVVERYGIEPLRVQHWTTSYYLRNGVFCQERPDVPILKIKHVEARVRELANAHWIGYGYRKQESLERRGMLSRDWPDGICRKRGAFAPIAEWNTKQVLAFLRQRKIPLPAESKASGRANSMADLSPRTLAFMREMWPSDYRRILRVFPYAIAQADRHAGLETAKRADQQARRAARRQQRAAQ
jgi:phosphoadenosine phosphosulfate reductase